MNFDQLWPRFSDKFSHFTIKASISKGFLVQQYEKLIFGTKASSVHHLQFYTESSKYYARLQTTVARGLGWPSSRLTGLHTAAAPKHSLCFSVQFPCNLVTHIDVHLQSGNVSVYWLRLLLDISAVSVVTVLWLLRFVLSRQEFSLRERVYIHNIYMKSRNSCSETRRKFRIVSRTTCA